MIPEYIWFNGKVNYTLRETKLDPSKVVKINSFEGSPTDGKSMIWPIKVFRGKQPYDIGQQSVGGVPHLRQGRQRLLGQLQLGQGDANSA